MLGWSSGFGFVLALLRGIFFFGSLGSLGSSVFFHFLYLQFFFVIILHLFPCSWVNLRLGVLCGSGYWVPGYLCLLWCF